MQVGKAGAVAAGALATVAVFGSAAAAAPTTDAVTGSSTATTALTMGKQAVPELATWNQNADQPLITIGLSSSVKVAPWQICGSNVVGGAGAAAAASTANTVVGDCYNANVLLRQN
jgi:hypothetical protein